MAHPVLEDIQDATPYCPRVPETLTPEDPLPERAILFRIHIDEIFGRAATSR